MTLKCEDKMCDQCKIFTVTHYHDVEWNAGVRDTSSTCAITVMLTSSSKAVCQHTDVCIRQLSYCSVKLLSLLSRLMTSN